MPFVKRDKNGQLQAVYKDKEPGIENLQMVSNDNQELRVFIDEMELSKEKGNPLRATDYQMVRVLEDLINILISKNFIKLTEFPSPAQEKILSRQSLRKNLSNLVGLVGDDEII